MSNARLLLFALLTLGVGLFGCSSSANDTGDAAGVAGTGAGGSGGEQGAGGAGGADGFVQTAAGILALPAGMPGASSDYRVLTPVGIAAIDAEGTFTAQVNDEGPSLVAVIDAQDRVVLLGFLVPGRTMQLDENATALVLLYYALRLQAYPPSDGVGDLLDTIYAEPRCKALAEKLAQLLAADPGALMSEESPVAAEVKAAVALIVGDGTSKLLSREPSALTSNALITATPTGPQSGVVVTKDVAGTGMQLINEQRRAGWYFVYKTAYSPAGEGAEVEISPPTLLAEGRIEAASEIPLSQIELAERALGESGFVARELPLSIPIEVSDAEREVKLEVAVAGAHLTDDSRWFDASDPRHKLWRSRADEMSSLSFVQDVFLPTYFSLILALSSDVSRVEVTPENAHALVGTLSSELPRLRRLLDTGDWYGATVYILKATATNQTVLHAVRDFVRSTVAVKAGEVAFAGMNIHLLLLGADSFIRIIDQGLPMHDGIVVRDVSSADELNRWDVTAVRSPVLLTADPNVLTPSSSSTIITAEVPDFPAGQPFCYRWTLHGGGEITSYLADTVFGAGATLVTEDRELQYLLLPDEVKEGRLAIIDCEPFVRTAGESCSTPPVGEPVGIGSIEIRGRDPKVEPCTGSFNVDFWRVEDNGLNLQASGKYGEIVTASFNVPSDDHYLVHLFIPRSIGGREDVQASPNVTALNVEPNRWTYLDIQRDYPRIPGPIRCEGASLSFSARGPVTIRMPTVALEVPCEFGPSGLPCCPYWDYDETFGRALTGPIVGLSVSGGIHSEGGGRSIAVIESN